MSCTHNDLAFIISTFCENQLQEMDDLDEAFRIGRGTYSLLGARLGEMLRFGDSTLSRDLRCSELCKRSRTSSRDVWMEPSWDGASDAIASAYHK
mmetsp:Transcript_145422/g.464696  ORF Transcript_145422/g.464696 Transcript_145422/m.464696 type:complete len:95 (-) Transcript_145422:2288-2572(-)